MTTVSQDMATVLRRGVAELGAELADVGPLRPDILAVLADVHAQDGVARLRGDLDRRRGLGAELFAGGVAVSGLEMCQNSARLSWTRDEVDKRLHGIMKSIHKTCVEASEAYGTPGNYVNGANIGGFLKVARAMMEQGLV